MSVRDRVSRLRIQASPYVCPTCLSRGYTTQSLPTVRSFPSLPTKHERADNLNLRRYRDLKSHPLPATWIRLATGAALASSTSPLESSLHTPSNLGFENPEDVRNYLKKWSQDHQKSIKDNAPSQVQLQRTSALPNSLFIRNNNDAVADAEDEASVSQEIANPDAESAAADEFEDAAVTPREVMRPGDAFRINGDRIRSQLAIYLGMRGVQSLYLLADGRWYADCQTIFNSYIVRGIATQDELSRIEPHLPLRAIEYTKTEDGATVPFTALGEIPHSDSRPLLNRLAALAEEIEEAKRDYPAVNDRIYAAFADENDFKHGDFKRIVHDHLHVDYDTLTHGAKMLLRDSLWHDERFMLGANKNTVTVSFVPKKMHRSVVQVTQWARSYQDAAARASTGKSVSEELQKNPIIPFISKARKLISRSRKIRLPTMECELGPTLEDVRPPAGTIDRRPTGEVFTEDEKKIIEFLWLVCVKRPRSLTVGGKRDVAIASLVVRAVGAYPKFTLDSATATLFLKELGCLDPWTTPSEHFVNIPNPYTSLHQQARLMKEKAMATVAEFGMQIDDKEPRLPDTMAHLRKDWGDLEVFCIDSGSTVVLDDGISIEQSQEFPDHHWIRVHIAHPSAFLPHDSPLLTLGELMGSAQYHVFGSEPYMPYEFVNSLSLRANQSVLTVSTLLSLDGSIKDIDIKPGIIRNVIRVDTTEFSKSYKPHDTTNTLWVGNQGPVSSQTDLQASEPQRKQNGWEPIQRHRATFDLLQNLVLSRWEARYRENPAHLQMLKLPNSRLSLQLHPRDAVKEGMEHERIFRSEHVFGDPSITCKITIADQNRVSYPEQSIKNDVVAGAMMLACEAAALWAAARDIPFVYRYTKEKDSVKLSNLNALGPHDSYISLTTGESVDVSPSPTLGAAGYANVTSPLRRYRDLLNHYQIDAYLKALAERSEDQSKVSARIQYPYSRQELMQVLENTSNGAELVTWSNLQKTQWLIKALYRAFYFQEAKLPDVWDVFIDNPVNLRGRNEVTKSRGTIYALALKVSLESTEEGWEKMAKFRQYLPSKLVSINPNEGLVICKAIGPPSDEPYVKDLAYPPIQAEEVAQHKH